MAKYELLNQSNKYKVFILYSSFNLSEYLKIFKVKFGGGGNCLYFFSFPPIIF